MALLWECHIVNGWLPVWDEDDTTATLMRNGATAIFSGESPEDQRANRGQKGEEHTPIKSAQ